MVKTRNMLLTYTQIIALGFFIIILIGAVLLSLPIASNSGVATPFLNSIFTAVSATCVTGLVIYDTFTHWSIFGQVVILILIQVGGLGFMTIVTFFSIFLKRRIGLKERRLLMESASTLKIGGIVALIKKILFRTFIFESLGTVFLAIRFCPEMGFKRGIYNSLFHSVSAFCNAGFDLMGKYGQFTSLTRYSGDIIINLTIISLVVIGGIGFFVWDDVTNNRLNFKKYQLHTKIVLTTTGFLIISGAILFFLFERSYSFAGMNTKEMVLASLFQSVTPRTAGFNTIDISGLSESGNLLTIILMIIGGSPGSTAGGIKTTTLMVLILGTISSAKHTGNLSIFKRRLEDNALKRASSIAVIYIFASIISAMLICATQSFSLEQALFEVFSAAGTVGLSTGITPSLSSLSKIVVMFLMFGGRVGGLSIALVFAEKREVIPITRPVEKIIIG